MSSPGNSLLCLIIVYNISHGVPREKKDDVKVTNDGFSFGYINCTH